MGEKKSIRISGPLILSYMCFRGHMCVFSIVANSLVGKPSEGINKKGYIDGSCVVVMYAQKWQRMESKII